jgi:hypothetical protein
MYDRAWSGELATLMMTMTNGASEYSMIDEVQHE